ncbi:hypothetical protein [Cecembia lonarensis]|uniref:Por secretion system C-terminal sorting domain-containing protein n=1 Tax=Cecembia lonarensis (strain CCUG 58316 / KCTC 22772 / LW9) TaxID=1225176 RepID=K1LUU8_CECL9|nr:hypothetical protein [Cecembia lonarensis]EKB47924.1 hypothetical protein B879_03482 [Cecembia lonarensis LW9]
MKVLFTMMIAFGVAFSTIAAGERPAEVPVSLRKVDESKVQLLYGAAPEGSITVKIYDSSKFLVKTDRINSKNAFARYYDFSQLKPGKYTLEVIDGQNKIEKLSVDFSAEVSKAPVVYSTLESQGNNAFKLMVNALHPATLNVYVFENDKLIHEEVVDQVHGFQKLYKLQGISPLSRVEFMVKTDEGFLKMMTAR